MRLRLLYILATTIVAGAIVVLTDGGNLPTRVTLVSLAVCLYGTFIISVSAYRLVKILRANGPTADYFDIDESELTEEFRTSIAGLERRGFTAPERVLRPVATTFRSKSTMVLMFSQNCDVIACVSDVCGHFSVSFGSVFDVSGDNDASLWTMNCVMYETADRHELWQCLPRLNVSSLHEAHLVSVAQMAEQGIKARSMDEEACVAFLKAGFERKHARIMQAPFAASLRIMTQWMFGWSRYRGRIETQMAGRATLERILERAHLVPNV